MMVCTFTGWVEAYPTKTEKANEVAWFLLRGIISRFGFPLSVESDNEPAFVAELLQLVCKAVNIKWKLYTAYRPQRSRMVERMNRTIKVTLAKWVQETGTPLDGLVAINVKEHQHDTRPRPCRPGSPYEIMFGRAPPPPPPLIWEAKGNSLQRGGMEVLRCWGSLMDQNLVVWSRPIRR